MKKDKEYIKTCLLRLVFGTFLFICLFTASSAMPDYLRSWRFILLTGALLLESQLQRIGRFHMIFGIVVIVWAFVSMKWLGPDLPIFVMAGAVLLGEPLFTAACALGGGLWIALGSTVFIEKLSVLNDKGLEWLVLVLVAGFFFRTVMLRTYYNKRVYMIEGICFRNVYVPSFLLIITGIVLGVLNRFKVFSIPEWLRDFHPILTGAGMILMWVILLYLHGSLDKPLGNSGGEALSEESEND